MSGRINLTINIFTIQIYKISDMNKRSWFIPVLIIAVNVLAIIIRWNSMSEIVPAHFDLEGNAAGSMPRGKLLMFPILGVVICLISHLVTRFKPVLEKGMVILSSGVSLVLLLSVLVTLTSGTMPVFMLAEPVVLLAAVVGFVICVVKARKTSRK